MSPPPSQNKEPRIIEEHGFRVEDEGSTRHLSIPYIKRRTPASIGAAVSFLLVLAAVLTERMLDAHAGSQLWHYPALCAGIAAYVTLVAAINRIRVRADESGFLIKVRPLPWRPAKRFRLPEYRGPYVAERLVKRIGSKQETTLFDLRMMNDKGKPYSMLKGFEDEAAARYAARVLQRVPPESSQAGSNGSPG